MLTRRTAQRHQSTTYPKPRSRASRLTKPYCTFNTKLEQLDIQPRPISYFTNYKKKPKLHSKSLYPSHHAAAAAGPYAYRGNAAILSSGLISASSYTSLAFFSFLPLFSPPSSSCTCGLAAAPAPASALRIN